MELKKIQLNNVPIDFDFDRDFESIDYEGLLKDRVNHIIKKFGKNSRWDFEELISEARLALCESGKNFQPEYNNNFANYARVHIDRRLKEFISRNMYTVNAKYYSVAKTKNAEETIQRLNKQEASTWSENKSKNPSASPLLGTPSGMMNPLVNSSIKEERSIVRDILNNELTPRQRNVLIWRYRDGMPLHEIAAKLGNSIGAVHNAEKAGLSNLRLKLQAAGVSSEDFSIEDL